MKPVEMKVAFLTNLIPPYHKPLFDLLTRHYSQFRLFISTPMESNRPWLPEWSGLEVVVQKGPTLSRKWRHPRGFDDQVAVHFPTDTFQQLQRFHPDAIISVEMGFRTLIASAYARMHPRCRLLIWTEVTAVTEHGRGTARRLLRRLLARQAHAFLAVGTGGARYIQGLNVSPDKIFQIAYSTALEAFAALPLERSGAVATRLLYSGQLIERKGLSLFLKTLARWASDHPARQVEFRLAGDGPLKPVLAAMPLPPNVKLMFIGTVQYNQLPEIYAESGIFVLPTLADTWAVVVNEAMASGVPVLGSIYSQAVEEMVEDGKTGWVFHADNGNEMYGALDRALCSRDEELNLMRDHARRRALQITSENTASVCQRALNFALGKS